MLPHQLSPGDPTVPTGSIVAGRYRLERMLGVGGMGVVYLARHLVLGERVALKFMLPRLASMPEANARFVIEARSQFRIVSERVVRVLDIGETDSGAPYIAMEYVEGRSLREMMDHQRLDVGTACEIVRQVCEALTSAHALGIVHRDVKPSNVLVTRTASGTLGVKLLDFGIAHVIDEQREAGRLTGTSTIIGTLAYCAPEQLRAMRSADARSDIWSLGAVLYEVLTGKLPYDADSPADLVLQQIQGPPIAANARAPEVPVAVAAIVERCFAFEPEDRKISAAQLGAALAPFARADSNSAPSAPVLATNDRDIAFRPRKVMDTAGGTAFVMHEPVRTNGTAVLHAASTTARRSNRGVDRPPVHPWQGVVVPLAALLALATVALGIMAIEIWSRSPDPSSAARIRPSVSATTTKLPRSAPPEALSNDVASEVTLAFAPLPPANRSVPSSIGRARLPPTTTTDAARPARVAPSPFDIRR